MGYIQNNWYQNGNFLLRKQMVNLLNHTLFRLVLSSN